MILDGKRILAEPLQMGRHGPYQRNYVSCFLSKRYYSKVYITAGRHCYAGVTQLTFNSICHVWKLSLSTGGIHDGLECTRRVYHYPECELRMTLKGAPYTALPTIQNREKRGSFTNCNIGKCYILVIRRISRFQTIHERM